MKLYSYNYKGTDYDFTITRSARCKINDMQYEIFEELKNPEIVKLMSKSADLQNQLKEAKKENDEELVKELKDKINELSFEMIPQMKEVMKMQNSSIDTDKIAIILLKENKKYRDSMTDELAEEILDDMVETLGLEKYDEIMVGIVDKVFMLIQSLQDNLEKVTQKMNKEKSSPMLMS